MEKRLIDANDLYIPSEETISAMVVASAPTVLTIPENPTNGDMFQSIFPNAIIDKKLYTYCVCVKLPYHTRYDTGLLFDKDWWNAPYTEVKDGKDTAKV